MHGQQTGRTFDRHCALWGRLNFKSRRPGGSVAKNEGAWLQRVCFCGNRIDYRIGPRLIQDDLAFSESHAADSWTDCGFTLTGPTFWLSAAPGGSDV